ncbi:hypothetical protein EYF80_067141 [Liparis tanakae]|uniref:Uncharacterized protein n=1 Tax=Liparis tanakae TaxID=230148 RepID=A0A4Z2E1U6_9TELE|nr:hypothetical protein EYF80_067141 [Liparis tanakae]
MRVVLYVSPEVRSWSEEEGSGNSSTFTGGFKALMIRSSGTTASGQVLRASGAAPPEKMSLPAGPLLRGGAPQAGGELSSNQSAELNNQPELGTNPLFCKKEEQQSSEEEEEGEEKKKKQEEEEADGEEEYDEEEFEEVRHFMKLHSPP